MLLPLRQLRLFLMHAHAPQEVYLAAVGITARAPGRLARLAAAARNTAVVAVRGVLAPHRMALKNLADIPLTVAGVAGIDFAAFHWAHSWGWLVTGLSLMYVEHLIADEDQGAGGV